MLGAARRSAEGLASAGLSSIGVVRVGAEPWLYLRGPDGIVRVDADGEVRAGTAGRASDATIDALCERRPPRAGSLDDLAEELRDQVAELAGHRPEELAEVSASQCPTCSRVGLVRAGAHGNVVRCADCGLLFRPLDPGQAACILERYEGGVGTCYFERSPNADAGPIDGYEHYEEYVEVIRSPTLRRAQIERRMAHCPTPGGSVCDVGAAMGHDVVHLRSLGFDAIGLEPSGYSRRRALEKFGVLLEPGTLLDTDFADGSFDAMTYSDVFEHLLDPGSELARISRLLGPGGVLVLELPNQSSLVAEVVGDEYLYAEHVVFLGPREAERLLDRAGFEVLASYTEHDEHFLIERLLTPEQSEQAIELDKGERLTVVARPRRPSA